MDCDRIEDSYESYVLGALDSAEMESMTDHIDSCDRCSARIRDEAEGVAALAFAVPQHPVPAAVKARLFARIDAETQSTPRFSIAGFLADTGNRLAAHYAVATAAVFMVALIAGGFWFNQRISEIDAEKEQLVERVEQIDTEKADLASKVDEMEQDETAMLEMVVQQRALTYWATNPDVSVKRMSATNVSNRARGMVMVSSSGGRALVSALNLLPLPSDKLYKVWLVKGGFAFDAGSFTVDSTGYAQMVIELIAPLPEIDRILVTVETIDSAGPEGESVLNVDL